MVRRMREQGGYRIEEPNRGRGGGGRGGQVYNCFAEGRRAEAVMEGIKDRHIKAGR